MIQRIQSVYLFIAGIIVLAMYKIPVAEFSNGELIYKLFACHILDPTTGTPFINVVPMAVLPILSMFLSLFAIFKFNNRSFQIKLGKMNMLVLIVLIAVQVIYYFRIQGLMSNGKPGFSAIIPLVAILLIFMANKAIKKDDNLVKSADRIR